MEVSGKRTKEKNFSASRDSADDFELHCLPCDRDDIRIPAFGYCKNCNEHLCEACYKNHRKPAPCRNHVLLNKDTMPQTLSVPTLPDDFDTCTDHEDELKFYCRDHNSIVCNICVTIDHRVCKIDYIPKLSKHLGKDDELQRMMTELKALEDKCKSKVKSTEKSKNNMSKAHANILADIQTFRKEINVRLDEMERKVKEEANSIMNAEQKRLGDVLKTCEDVRKKTEHLESSLDTLLQRKQFNRLFIEMKKAKAKYDELVATESQLQTEDDLQFGFVKNQAILDVLKESAEMGKLVSTGATKGRRSVDTNVPSQDKSVVLEHIGGINVACASDKKKCNITGMGVIPPNKIVVCDNCNCTVKCFNTQENKLESEIELSSSPFDVAVIAQNKLAVTAPDDKYIFILSSVDTRIAIDRRLDIGEGCCGIAYCQNKLIVSCNYNPGKVVIIDLSGKLINTFSEDLFGFPQYVAVDREERYIYVSESGYDKCAVYKLDWQGRVVGSFREEWHQQQRGLQELDDGTFLVCLRMNNSNNIVRMSSSCKTCKVTGHEKFGNFYSRAICYSKEERTLYVSYVEEDGGFIEMLKVAWST